MSGKPIPEEAVAQVCDRMLTAAIGKDWRKRATEAVTAFWMGEVREALQEVVPDLTAAPALAQQPAASDSWRDAFVAERARRYRDGGMKIEQARIHAESDADLAIALATQHQEPKS